MGSGSRTVKTMLKSLCITTVNRVVLLDLSRITIYVINLSQFLYPRCLSFTLIYIDLEEYQLWIYLLDLKPQLLIKNDNLN